MAREAGRVRQVKPQDIFFTADSIRATFKRPHDKERIEDVAQLIHDGELSPRAFPPINVVEHERRLWTPDNKRLWVFRMAEVSFITVNIVEHSDKVSSIVAYPELYSVLANPDFLPEIRDKDSNKDSNKQRREERRVHDNYLEQQPGIAASPGRAFTPGKRKYTPRAEKQKLDAWFNLPSQQRTNSPGYYSQRDFQAPTLDDDHFFELGRNDASPARKDKLSQRKGKSVLRSARRSDMYHHHPTEKVGWVEDRSNRKRDRKAAPPPPRFYAKDGTAPEITVLSDSSCGQNPIVRGPRRQNFSKSRTNRRAAVSDEEPSYQQNLDAAAMAYLSDTSEYHVRGLHGSLPRRENPRKSMTPVRPAYRKPSQKKIPKQSKISEAQVQPGPAIFRSSEKVEKPPQKEYRSRNPASRHGADFQSGKNNPITEVPDRSAAVRKTGRAMFDTASEEETSPPQKAMDKKALKKEALPGKCRDAGADIRINVSPTLTPAHTREGTSARTRGGIIRSNKEKEAKNLPAELKVSEEPPLSPDLEAAKKNVPFAGAPDTPESVKNDNKFSNVTSVDPPDTLQGSYAGRRPTLCTIACQTDDKLFEDPDPDPDQAVELSSKKKRKLSKSGVEVRNTSREVDTKRPKSSAQTLKPNEISRKCEQQEASAKVTKLDSSDDEEAMVDCPIRVVTGTDELDKLLRQAKSKNPYLKAVRRSPQCPSDPGELKSSRTPDLELPKHDKKGRPKGADGSARAAPNGHHVNTAAQKKPNVVDSGNGDDVAIPEQPKPITKSEGEAQVGAAALQMQWDTYFREEERKNQMHAQMPKSNSNFRKESAGKKSKSAYLTAKEIMAKKIRIRRGKDRASVCSGATPVVETRSAAAHRPADKLRDTGLDMDQKSQMDDPEKGGSDLDVGDMVYLYVDAYHMGSGRPIPSLRKVGPFELLRKPKSGQAAKLCIPEDYVLPDAVLTTSLTPKLEEDSSKPSSIRTTVRIETAPEKVVLKRIVKPRRRRMKQELEYSYLVKWINFPVSEATWEPATIFKENPGLPEDEDVPLLSNPFLLRTWRC